MIIKADVIARPRSGRGNPHSLDCFVATKAAPRNDVWVKALPSLRAGRKTDEAIYF